MKKWSSLVGAAALPLPWIVLVAFHFSLPPAAQVAATGLAIIGSAFLLSWGAEVAQLEIPKSLAIAFVAIVAILPEYAVDIYVAAKAGRDPVYVQYAVANMTGANRLIIGLAWAMVVFLWWRRSKQTSVIIEKGHALEFSFLFLVTLYSLILPFKKNLSIFDGLVLVGFFVAYLWKAGKGAIEEPMLEGPAASLALLPRSQRRGILLLIFLFALVAIGTAAKPFTEGLIATGKLLHVEEFLLIQILAPLASEMPEFIVAGVLAYNGNPSLGFGSLLASKLEQWTLLVGMVPLVYAVSLVTGGHSLHPLQFDNRQVEEMLLTSAQSLFAIALVADFNLSLLDGSLLAILYVSQYFFPLPQIREIYAVGYIVLALVILCSKKSHRQGINLNLSTLRRKEQKQNSE